jgi:hypothetical protein
MAHCGQRVRFAATWREEFFEVPFISNSRWNAWIGKRKELRLQLVTDWPTTKPWPYTFSTSGDSKILSTTDASVDFMNSVADASKVEIKDDNGALLATVDMKDSEGISPKTATGTAGTLSPSDVADFVTKFDAEATPGQGSTRP